MCEPTSHVVGFQTWKQNSSNQRAKGFLPTLGVGRM